MDDNKSESTPLTAHTPSYQSTNSSVASSEDSRADGVSNNGQDNGQDYTAGDTLGRKLIACNNNEDLEQIVLRRSLDISYHTAPCDRSSSFSIVRKVKHNGYPRRSKGDEQSLFQKMVVMLSLALLGLLILFCLLQVSSLVVGPPSQPVGPYALVEVQVRSC